MKGLLEREEADAALRSALDDARAGAGRVVLISGEAGIGKSSLVHAFLDGLEGARVLRGACDDLATPLPLGPIRDLATQGGEALREVFAAPPERERVLQAMLDELQRPPHPAVVVIEDAHWADDATIDVLTFLSRRIDAHPALLLLTLRDGELDETHRLRALLGGLASSFCVRVPLQPLSSRSVRALAREVGTSAEDVFEATGGNPFYVTELLAARGEGVPATIREAVLARAAQLPRETRELLDLLSVIPARAETWLLDLCQPGWDEASETAERRGTVRLEDGALGFRHELARRAVEGALPASRRRALNARVLEALREREALPARIVHHAEQAGDIDALVAFAPLAARNAAAVSAHREAAAHYRRALVHAARFEPPERATLQEELTLECFATDRREEGLASAQAAVDLRRAIGEAEPLGRALRLGSRASWWSTRGQQAQDLGEEAIAVLEAAGPSAELARAYGNLAQLAMAAQAAADLENWGGKAVAMASEFGDEATLAHAYISMGTDRYMRGVADSSMVEEGIDLARRTGLDNDASRAYANLAYVSFALRRYDEAERWLDQGQAYAQEHEVLSFLGYMRGTRAWVALDRGRWDQALEEAAPLLVSVPTPLSSYPALYVATRISARRGDPLAAEYTSRLWALAEPTGEMQRICPAASANAELAWLEGRLEQAVPKLEWAFALARASQIPRVIGDVGIWLHRAGALPHPPEEAEEPYLLQMRGQWREAADAWTRVGCVYERADALSEGEEPEALLEALRIFDELGAAPRSARTRARLRQLGVTSIPRGPAASTRANPAQLTGRQLDVLRLMGDGLTNTEIADRLVLSTRTVDHHVSAILAKLESSTRREAAERAAELGMLGDASPA
ncbi:MAG: AAA family ATPase [Dehalococcoidia bacterium]|nr:AAA family ATPase [Dehalococcoidia bacterium]